MCTVSNPHAVSHILAVPSVLLAVIPVGNIFHLETKNEAFCITSCAVNYRSKKFLDQLNHIGT